MARPARPKHHKPQARRSLVFPAAMLGFLLATAALLFWLGSAPPGIGAPFRLFAGDGRVVTSADLRGRYVLLYFGYTSCPDVCPTTLATMVAALRQIDPDARRIQPVFITIDPGRDTPALMARYTAEFSTHLLGLTGPSDSIDAIERAYHVRAAEGPPVPMSTSPTSTSPTSTSPTSTSPGLGDRFEHTAALYLLDPAGRFLTALPPDQDSNTLAATLAPLLSPARSPL